MNAILEAAIHKCGRDYNKTLLQALGEAHAFRLRSGERVLRALRGVVPENEWDTLKGPDAVAALELADAGS